MQFISTRVKVAASFRVAQVDFMVYTFPPVPTDSIPKFTDAAELSGWSLSVAIVANSAYDSLTKELGSSYSSSQLSAASEIEAFVQSARNYSIPVEITDIQTITTFFWKPKWYDALPTGARAFKESQVSGQFSMVRFVIAAGAITASSLGATITVRRVPIAHAFLDGRFGAIAAAAAAAAALL